MSKTYRKEPAPKPRSSLPHARHHIYGWPREHYTAEHREKHPRIKAKNITTGILQRGRTRERPKTAENRNKNGQVAN